MMKSSTLTNFATGEICNLCGEPVIGEHVDWLHPDCYQQIMDDAREADEAEYQRVAALAKERGCSVEEMHIIEYAMEQS